MKNKYKAILFFGPPGSGKSTQAKLLDKKRFFYISSGELLRHFEENARFRKSVPGKKIARIMASGGLIPDDIMFEFLELALEKEVLENKFRPKKQILILDGIPRDISQVKKINTLFHVIKIIDIDVPDDTILINRLIKRAKEEGRIDDGKTEIIRKRLAVYNNETNKILAEYPNEIIFKINGSDTVEKINRQIKKYLINAK